MINETLLGVFFLLLVGHALGDFVFQSEWMVLYKNHKRRPTDMCDEYSEYIWIHLLTAHALVHGGAVALVTGNLWLGLAETVLHWLIDYGKSDGRYGFHFDQMLHITCKLAWAGIWLLA